MLRVLLKLYAWVGISVVAAVLIIMYTFGYVFYDLINRSTQEQLQGYAWLINQRFEEVPEAQWPARLAELQAHAKDQFELVPLANFPLFRESARASLEAGLPVQNDSDGEHYALRIGKSNWVISTTMATDLNLRQISYLGYSLLALVMLVGVLTWVMWFWHDMRILNRAARRFGEGDLDVRAKVSRHSNLQAQVQVFNSMADRIQDSIVAQKDMINAVSHELRTPIARLDFGLEILRQRGPGEDSSARIAALKDDIRELDGLVTELLGLARLDQLTAPPALQAVSLRLVLDSLAASCVDALQVRSIALDIAVDPAADRIHVEPRLLARAVQNLLGNAIRHAVRRVACGARVTPAGDIEIHVDDDGAGIASADRERIFDPFVRLDDSRNRATGGFGLGLAIVRRIARLHGGHVDVQTSPLGGARFTLTVPGHRRDA